MVFLVLVLQQEYCCNDSVFRPAVGGCVCQATTVQRDVFEQSPASGAKNAPAGIGGASIIGLGSLSKKLIPNNP